LSNKRLVLSLLLLLVYLGHHRHSAVVGYQGDGSVSQDDVIRFVLAVRSKEGATASDRARMRHYQRRLPSLTLGEAREPNSIHSNDDEMDKSLYGRAF